jgi:protein-disulfide isomerase
MTLPPESRRRFLKATGSLAFSLSCPAAFGQQGAAPSLQLMRFHAPNLGPADARVNLVEFLDPACEACAAFYPTVKQILGEHPGRVRLWVRYVPFHRGADVAVKALEATRAQGKYWESLERLLSTQKQWTRNHSAVPERIIAVLDGTGLDMPRLQRDMASPDTVRILELDLADAKALKVVQTPTFFVNGRSLEDFGMEQLRAAVRDEVRRQYP